MNYDMMGLEMYDDGLGAWMTPEMLKQSLMAGGAGALGILLTSAVVQRIPLPEDWEPSTQSYVKSLIAIGVGVLGGRALYEYNPNAAMGFVGGVVGLGLAELVSGLAGVGDDGNRYLTTGLSGAGISGMDLAALEAAVVSPARAFVPGGMRGTVVSGQQLQAPGVTAEHLGMSDHAQYQAWLS